MRNPGRAIPRSIIFSVIGMMILYLALNIGVLGVVPWQVVAHSSSIASLILEQTWGVGVSRVVTVLIIITAFASVFTGLLGGSRVPYNAARDGIFLRVFDKLHPRYRFPYIALIVMGAITAIGSFFDLTTVINMLIAVTVLVQGIGQVVALFVLRRKQARLKRPYRMWLYPLPAIIALVGWIYVYYSSGSTSIISSLIWVVAGIVAFLIWARVEHTWPFGSKEIREAYLEEQAQQENTSAVINH